MNPNNAAAEKSVNGSQTTDKSGSELEAGELGTQETFTPSTTFSDAEQPPVKNSVDTLLKTPSQNSRQKYFQALSRHGNSYAAKIASNYHAARRTVKDNVENKNVGHNGEKQAETSTFPASARNKAEDTSEPTSKVTPEATARDKSPVFPTIPLPADNTSTVASLSESNLPQVTDTAKKENADKVKPASSSNKKKDTELKVPHTKKRVEKNNKPKVTARPAQPIAPISAEVKPEQAQVLPQAQAELPNQLEDYLDKDIVAKYATLGQLAASGEIAATTAVQTSQPLEQVPASTPQSAAIVARKVDESQLVQVDEPTTNHHRQSLKPEDRLGAKLIIEQVAATANTAKQQFTAQLAQGTQAILANVQKQQQALNATNATQSQVVRAAFGTARNQISAVVSQAQSKLQADVAVQQALLTQTHATNLTNTQNIFTQTQTQAQTLGSKYGKEAITLANTTAQNATTEVQGAADEARELARSKAGSGKPEVAQAKTKAANELAEDTATNILKGLDELTTEIKSTGPEVDKEFQKQGQEAGTQLVSGLSQVISQLNNDQQQTTSALQKIVQTGDQSLAKLKTQFLDNLAAQEQKVLSQLQTQAAQQSQALATAGQKAVATFNQQGQEALKAGDAQVARFNAQIASKQVSQKQAPELASEAISQIKTAYNNLTDTAHNGLQQVQAGINHAGGQASSSLVAIAGAANGQAQAITDQARNQVTQQTEPLSTQLTATVTQFTTSSQALVEQVSSNLTEQLDKLEQGFVQGLTDYQKNIEDKVTEATTKAREPLGDLGSRIDQAHAKIDAEAAKAEERSKKNWFEQGIDWVGDQFAQLGKMLTDPGFWAGLITGLVLGAIVVLLVAGTALSGGALLLVMAGAMAVVGAIAACVGTIVSNVAHGRDWHENVIQNMIIGAIGGAVSTVVVMGLSMLGVGALGILAASVTVSGLLTVITNVATGEPWDKNLIGNMLLAGLLAKLSGFGRGKQTVADKNVNPTAPATKPLSRPIGKNSNSNGQQAQVNIDILEAQTKGSKDFVVNQQQVNAQGQRVGNNRPDLQYTNANGRRVYIEYDTPGSNRGIIHKQRILANDPDAIVILKVIPEAQSGGPPSGVFVRPRGVGYGPYQSPENDDSE